MVNKYYQIGIERSLKFRITADRQINLFEQKKMVRKECYLGKDMIFIDSNLRLVDNYDLVWDKRRDIWNSSYRYEQQPKAGEIIEVKIVIEWNGVEKYVDE
jgi:hypothetical protein